MSTTIRSTLLCTTLICVIPGAYAFIVGGEVTHARCGQSNGSIIVYPIGGSGNYTYFWDPVPPTGQGTPLVSDLAPGSYTVSVTDGTGETVSETFTVLGYSDLLGSDFQQPAQDGHANCPGGCGGQFRVPESYLPGVAPYTYSEPVQGYDGLGEPFFFVPGGACSGEAYQITVTDATGCSGVMNVTIAGAQIGQPPMVVSSITGACSGPGGQGGSATFTNIYDGQFFAPPMMIVDLNGLGQMQQVATGNTITFTGLPPGTYTLQRQWDYMAYPCGEQIPFTIPDLGVACGSVSGQVFIDNNSDCARGPFEVAVPEQVLTIQPGPQYVITDNDGRYSIDLGDGSYSIEQNDMTLVQLCPVASPVPFTLAGDAQVVDLADSSTIQLDLVTQYGNSAARPGFPFTYSFRARNLSEQLSGIVTLSMTFDPNLVYNSASITPTSVVGNLITWTLPEINALGSYSLNVQFTVPPATPLGTMLTGTFTAATEQVDVVPGNDSVDLTTMVTGSYDPNDKRAFTSTRSSDDLYLIGSDEWIDYTIRFQNTGTDTAFTVVVTDTLNDVLDMATFQQGVASHPFSVSFKPDRVVEWHFANILLPDSNVNEVASHGLVTFRIRPIQPLIAGTVIANTANIFFDFNEPVITEPSVLVAEFSTAILDESMLELRVFPNPTDQRIDISTNEALITTLTVTNTDGRMVLTRSSNSPTLKVDVHSLRAGAYFVEATLTNGKVLRGRFIKN